MPKVSDIPNRIHLNLTANAELVRKAKDMGINMSLLFDAALEREINPAPKEAFNKAQELQNRVYKDYIADAHKLKDFEDWKWENKQKNVVEKKTKQEDKQAPRSFTGI